MFYINRVEELPLTIFRLNKKVAINYHYLQITSIICFQSEELHFTIIFLQINKRGILFDSSFHKLTC